jgi:GMP synthase (glutamine-hydrolysing)
MIAIIDFGSQYTQLIARRVRELKVYSEIYPSDKSLESILEKKPEGVILSGGPDSVYAEGAQKYDRKLFNQEIPILGICYGMQLMNHSLGGEVLPSERREYGRMKINVLGNELFNETLNRFDVWMSHGDSVNAGFLASDFEVVATSSTHIAAIADSKRKLYGLQFHPEVQHTEYGMKILGNFLDICGCNRNWSMEDYIDRQVEEMRDKVGDGNAVVLVSGGVDSTVAAVLASKALGDNLFALHIDTGLMRMNESKLVAEALGHLKNFRLIDASREFLDGLKDVTDPEKKRKIIGDIFVQIAQRELSSALAAGIDAYLIQGTLYTDRIESGKGCGKNAAVIKSHHNVNTPLIVEMREKGYVIEPNAQIFKDEVREVGRKLGISEELIKRQPFPGPGLAIRVVGQAVTRENVELVRKADYILLDEIKKAGVYDDIWQAFCGLLPVRSVGVMGDARTYQEAIGIRAVNSLDGMTADWYGMDVGLLQKISNRITNEIPEVNRVFYDVTSKPPGTIEWE